MSIAVRTSHGTYRHGDRYVLVLRYVLQDTLPELTSTSCIFLKKDTTLAYLLHWGRDDSDSRCIYAHPTGTSSLPVLPDCVTVTVAFRVTTVCSITVLQDTLPELTSHGTSCIFLKKDTTLAYLLHWGRDDSDSDSRCIYAHPTGTGTSSLPVLPDCTTVTVVLVFRVKPELAWLK